MRKQRFLVLAMVILILSSISVAASGFDEVVGVTNIRLMGDREHIRTQETNLGNLITDMLREASGADVAIYNGGSIRATIDMGEITLENVMEVLAFDNEIVTLEVTGAQLLAALEIGYASYPQTFGGFLQVSGLRVYLDPLKPAGERVVKLYVGKEPVQLDKTYVLVTNEFLSAGGDGFDVLKEGRLLSTLEHTEQVLLLRYLVANQPVTPRVEGRIVILK